MDSYCWNVTGQIGNFYTPCFNNTNFLASLKHPMQRLVNFIDSVNTSISRLVSLLILLMVVITFIIVVMRYAFGYGFVWMQELLLWFHGIVLMSGISYTMLDNQHVRVDVLYRNFNKKKKAKIEIINILFFVMPLSIYLIYISQNFVGISWEVQEISRDSGGLPFPAIPLIKTMLIVMPTLLSIQGLSILYKNIKLMRS